MPVPLVSVSFILALSIFAIGLPRNSAAQPHQSQAAFETALNDAWSSPYVVRITVVDDRTGQASTGCTIPGLLRGAIYIEKWGAIAKVVTPETQARSDEVKRIALENKSHVFHFSNPDALKNIPFRFPEACAAIERGKRARVADLTGEVILGPFVEGPGFNLRFCPPPSYPAKARATNEGGATIALLVGPDGDLRESKVTGSSGSARQDEAIRVALSACKFSPRTVDGVPSPDPVWTTIRIGNRSAWLNSGRGTPPR